MEVLQNRLDSFVKQKRGKALKWPHPKTWEATPQTLAEAGFYFDPSPDDPDNVTCFMCNKQVTEWAQEDDPFDIHWEKCAKVCAWANLRCGLRRDVDSYGRYVFPDKSRLPTSKAMEKARLETFAGYGWKHDKDKKHSATSKKMAQAGFIFTPTEAGDDTGTCLYCNIALGNWDEDDDPMKQHRDRDKPSDPCPFLTLASGAPLPASKSQAKQPKTAKRAPKAKPSAHTEMVMPTKLYDGSDSDSPVPFPGTVAKTPRKAASSSTAKTPRTMTRSSSRANTGDERGPLYQEEEITPPPKKRGRSKSVSRAKVSEDEPVADRAPTPPTRQRRPTAASRSRSKSVSRPASALDPAHLFDDEDEPPRPAKPAAKADAPRKSSRSKSKARELETDVDDAEPVARKTSRAKPKAREDDTAADLEEDPAPPKPSRTKSKATVLEEVKAETKKPSRSQAKSQAPPDDESSDDGWFVAALPPPPPSRSKAKSVSRTRGKDHDTDLDEPVVASRKEQKKRQDAEVNLDAPTTKRMPSKSRAVPAPSDREADEEAPVARKSSQTKSKTVVVEEEVRKPPSRAKSKPAPPPADAELTQNDDIGMEQYLPPRPVKSKPKVARVGEVGEAATAPKEPRGRKPSSRSTSKSVPPTSEAAVAPKQVVEEPEPPKRTRKPSSRSTAAVPPPASRSASTMSSVTAKPKSKTKRDPSPLEPDDLGDLEMYGRFAPEDEEEDEPVVRPVSKSKPPSSKPRAVSPSPPPVQKPRSMSQTQLRASKSKAAESHIEYESGDGLKVVDISTDDEGPQTAAPKSKGKGKAKSKADVEVQLQPAVEDEEVLVQTQPDSPLPSPRAEFPMDDGNDDDVEMAEVEDSIVEPESLPATPPRAAAPARSVLADEDSKRPASPHGSAFIPPLATDPFVNINELSEAEQDMTVEEWIRYQMGIEYERFKRDGERQLGMFERRAEEVRRAIETL